MCSRNLTAIRIQAAHILPGPPIMKLLWPRLTQCNRGAPQPASQRGSTCEVENAEMSASPWASHILDGFPPFLAKNQNLGAACGNQPGRERIGLESARASRRPASHMQKVVELLPERMQLAAPFSFMPPSLPPDICCLASTRPSMSDQQGKRGRKRDRNAGAVSGRPTLFEAHSPSLVSVHPTL